MRLSNSVPDNEFFRDVQTNYSVIIHGVHYSLNITTSGMYIHKVDKDGKIWSIPFDVLIALGTQYGDLIRDNSKRDDD